MLVRWIGWRIAFMPVLGGVFLTGTALAQEFPAVQESALAETLYLLSPQRYATTNPLLQRGPGYRGIKAGEFLLYPGLLAGAVIDDNLSWSNIKPKTPLGVRLRPDILAVRDNGKHKTSLYGMADATFFPSMSRGNNVKGKAALAHKWEIQNDLFFKANAGFTRDANYVSGGTVTTPGGVSTALVSPQYSNVTHASLALQKTFGRFFTGISGMLRHTSYSTLETAAGPVRQNNRDNLLSKLNLRAGVWFAPVFYGFAEASANIRNYSNVSTTSRGQSLVAGIGSDRISLFRGEIFAGAQRQTFSQPLIADSVAPLFGGKLYWYPTRAWIINVTLQQDFSDISAPTPGNPGGFPKRTTTANLNINYKMARHWSASLRSGYARSVYQSSARRDRQWYAGTTFTYDLYRNVSLTLDLDHYRLDSNVRTASYTHTIYKLGARYRY